MKTSSTLRLTALVAACILHPSSFLLAAGSLTPPGAPAPTMKSLAEIEPRTPISSLPFNISASGSYYLTGNLTAAAPSDGIIITANHVTLDLGGFQLLGAGGGAGSGVRVGPAATNVVVRNGTVRGWGFDGVGVAAGASDVHVEKVLAIANGMRGFSLGIDATATGCTAQANVNGGIYGNEGSRVIGCTASGQTGASAHGIRLGEHAVVKNCVATGNGEDGINVGSGSVVSHCTAQSNSGDGIQVASGAVVQACTAFSNSGVGIVTSTGGAVSDSTADSNSGTSGISAGIGSSVIHCVARNNISGSATSQGIRVSDNSTVIECTVAGNTTTAATTASTGMGISTGSECVVKGCTVMQNRGDGIRAVGDCRIAANWCSENGNAAGSDGAGIHTTGTGNYLDGNIVANSLRGIDVDGTESTIVRNKVRMTFGPNFQLAASNNLGLIVNPGNNGAFAGDGPLGSSLGTTDPWANISD